MRMCRQMMENWQFAKLAAVCDAPPQMLDAELRPISLPHVWNKDQPEAAGCCLYQTKWEEPELPAKKHWFVAFDAVGGVARVFLNGVDLGEHRGGYSRFCFDATHAMRQGQNRLQVLADNTRYPDVNPLLGDFTYFGGIYRTVSLLQTNDDYFLPTYYGTCGLEVEADANGSIRLNAWVQAGEGAEVEYRITDACDNTVAQTRVAAASPGVTLTVAAPRLWDGQNDPYLYCCTAVLWKDGAARDSVSLPFGFRGIRLTPEQGFFLNGQPMRLHGVAKHQDFAGMGCAPTEAQLELDQSIIREIGANAVRLSHYQHPQFVYDQCDRDGLVVWAEIPMLAMPDNNPEIIENAKQQLTELILQNRHHPSICFWGVQNEIAMLGESAQTYCGVKELNALVKRLDPSRISAGANLYCVQNNSPLNFLNDAVGYNIYFGWYYGALEDYGAFLARFHADNPEVPLGITEYGVDCNLQYHSDAPVCKDYTEEFQCVYHETVYAAIEADERLWGSFVWNMFDFSSAIRDEGGIKAQNCKGLVSYDRSIRKDSFYFYKACWAHQPFVHLTGKRFQNRCGETTTVKAYSNCPSVTLCVNGVPFATREGRRVFVFEHVPLQPETVLTAMTDCGSDSMTLYRVGQPDPAYTYAKKGDGRMVTNWFTQFVGEAQTHAAVYSIADRMRDLLAEPRVVSVLEELIPEIAHDERAKMFGGMSLLRVLDRNEGLYGEETLKTLQQQLSLIVKPEWGD